MTIEGIIPVTITPFTDDGDLASGALSRSFPVMAGLDPAIHRTHAAPDR